MGRNGYATAIASVIAVVLLFGLSAFGPSEFGVHDESSVTSEWAVRLPISTDRQRIETLINLQKQFPDLFSRPVPSDRDLLEIMRHQDRVWNDLLVRPEFANIAAKRPTRVDIRIERSMTGSHPTVTIDPGAVESWRRSLLGALEGLKRSDETMTTDADQRLTDEIIRNLRSGSADRLRPLSALLQAHLLLQNDDAKISGTIDDVIKRIRVASEGSLRTLARPSDLQRELETFKQKIWRIDGSLQKALQPVADLLQRQIREIVADMVTVPTDLGVRLVLREAPPVLGVFRGFFGNDRSTEQGFLYANSPSERVFLAFDEFGLVKGYVGSTVVTSNTGRALFVHTINGARLSAADSEQILRALNLSRRELGVTMILVPTQERVSSNINFIELRAAFEKMASTQIVHFAYEDEALRAQLQKLARAYGIMSDGIAGSETEGRLLAVDGARLGQTSANFSVRVESTSLPTDEAAAASREDMLAFLLDLAVSGRTGTSTWQAVLGASGLKAAEVERVVALSRNETEKPVRQYSEDMNQILARYGADMTEDFVNRHWRFFIRGYIQSPDFLDRRHGVQMMKLIHLAILNEAGPIVGDILDLHGPGIMKVAAWRDRMARSDEMSALLLTRLSLLADFQPDARAALEEKIRKFSPGLLELFRSLMSSATADEFIRKVSTAQASKALIVRQGVRSALTRFFDLRPTPVQIRQLGLWMQNAEDRFFIKNLALARASTSADFVQIAEFDEVSPTDDSKVRMKTILAGHVDTFLKLDPSVDEVNRIRVKVSSSDLDLHLVRTMAMRVQSAEDYVKLTSLYSYIHSRDKDRVYWRQLRAFLETQISRFAALEPDVDQLNAFRMKLYGVESDFSLLELQAPKIGRADEFLKMLRLFIKSGYETQPEAYLVRLKAFAADHFDEFMTLGPTSEQIIAYRALM